MSKTDNQLNFDFDTPIEQLNKPRRSPDRTGKAKSTVRVNSVEVDSVSERFADRKNPDRPSRPVPNALTVDEVIGSNSAAKNSGSMTEPTVDKPTADTYDTIPMHHSSPAQYGDYSDAAQMIFRNMRKRLADADLPANEAGAQPTAADDSTGAPRFKFNDNTAAPTAEESSVFFHFSDEAEKPVPPENESETAAHSDETEAHPAEPSIVGAETDKQETASETNADEHNAHQFNIESLINSVQEQEDSEYEAITPDFAVKSADSKKVLVPIMPDEEEVQDPEDRFVAEIAAAIKDSQPTENELKTQHLIEQFSHLVPSIVGQYDIPEQELERAYSVAANGLEQAAENHPGADGMQFEQWASRDIEYAIQSAGFVRADRPAADETAAEQPKQNTDDTFDFSAIRAAAEGVVSDAADLGATAVFTAGAVSGAVADTAAKGTFEQASPFASPVYKRDIDFDADDGGEDDYADDEGFETVDDPSAVMDEFASRRRSLRLRSVFTAIITAALFALAAVPIISVGSSVFFTVTAVLTAVAMIINFNTVMSFFSMFRLSFGADTAPAVASVLSLAQSVVFAVTGASTASVMFAAAACLSLLFDDLGKLSLVRRTLLNLDLIANDEIKQATVLIDEPQSSVIVNDADFGDALISGRRNVIDLKGYVAHSFSPDMYESMSGRLFAITFATALIIGTLFSIRTGQPINFLTGVCAAMCLGAPISSLFCNNRALSKTCSKLRGYGTVLTGFDAAEHIGDSNVLVLDGNELFHDEFVTLHDIKSFGNAPLDQAILDAAAVLLDKQAPMSGMFYNIIGGKLALLPNVDSVVYEERMGLTGWTGGRKIIVGNRMIMEAHGVAVPPIDVDRKILQKGYRPVYVATEGKLSALFVVSYHPDEELLGSVQAAVETGMTVCVRTNDCNIDEMTVADAYGIYRESVKIMTADSTAAYDASTADGESEQALMCGKTTEGFVRGVIGAYRLQRNISVSSVMQAVFMCLGLGALLALSIIGKSDYINVFTVSIYNVVSGILSYAVHFFRKTV